MNWFTNLFKAEALPLQVNSGSADQLARHAGRLARLYAAQAKNSSRADLREEIRRRKEAIAAHGHPAPTNEAEAAALLAKVKG